MAKLQNFSIDKGRTGTIVVTVTGVSIWTGLIAKLFATDAKGGAILMTLTGTIDEGQNKISLSYTHNDTKDITLLGLYYEIVIYKEDRSYIKSTNYGMLNILPVVKTDPVV
jgi:hypothetical protein